MNVWEILKELESQNLSPLEFYIAREALGWFARSKKLGLPTADELALGARTYAKRCLEDGLTPFFLQKGAVHELALLALVTSSSSSEYYLPRTI